MAEGCVDLANPAARYGHDTRMNGAGDRNRTGDFQNHNLAL